MAVPQQVIKFVDVGRTSDDVTLNRPLCPVPRPLKKLSDPFSGFLPERLSDSVVMADDSSGDLLMDVMTRSQDLVDGFAHVREGPVAEVMTQRRRANLPYVDDLLALASIDRIS